MALVYGDDFETDLSGWTQVNTPVTHESAAFQGVLGVLIDTTGGASTRYLQRTLTAGTRVLVARAYVNIQTNPVGSPNFLQGNCTAGDCKITMLSTGALRAQVGAGTSQASSVLSAGWHRVDVRYNTTASPATIDWMIDGVAQTQASTAQTATDMSAIRIGLLTSTTARFYFDTVAYANAVGDYPIAGSSVSPGAIIATGTGATHVVQDAELYVLIPALSAGTGSVPGGGAAPRITGGFPPGTGAAQAAANSLAPSLALVTGTGTAYNTVSSGQASAGHASATGVSNAPNFSPAPGVESTRLLITMGVS
jgi:hypothetical protein